MSIQTIRAQIAQHLKTQPPRKILFAVDNQELERLAHDKKTVALQHQLVLALTASLPIYDTDLIVYGCIVNGKYAKDRTGITLSEEQAENNYSAWFSSSGIRSEIRDAQLGRFTA